MGDYRFLQMKLDNAAVVGTLDDVTYIRSLAELGGKYYSMRVAANHIYIDEHDSFGDTSATNRLDHTMTATADVDSIYLKYINVGGTDTLIVGYAYYTQTDDAATFNTKVICSTDGTDWTTIKTFTKSFASACYAVSIIVMDSWDTSDTEQYTAWAYSYTVNDDPSSGDYRNNICTVNWDTTTVKTINLVFNDPLIHVMGGGIDSSDNYHYLEKRDTVWYWKKMVYTPASDYYDSVASVATLTWLNIDPDLKNSYFIVQGNAFIFISNDYLQWYDPLAATWSVIASGSNSYTNGIMWYIDTATKKQKAMGIGFKNNFYLVFDGGGYAPLQYNIFPDNINIYCGWYVDSATKLNGFIVTSAGDYVFEHATTYNGNTFYLTKLEYDYNTGTLEVFDKTSTNYWGIDDFISLFAITETPTTHFLFQGNLLNIETKDFRKATFEALWVKDMRRAVSADYSGETTYTAHIIAEDVIHNWALFSRPSVAASTSTYDITFKQKTINSALRTFVQSEDWVLYCTTTGYINLNNGTSDSGVDIELDTTTTVGPFDIIYNVESKTEMQKVSQVELLGGEVDGVRITTIAHTTTAGAGCYFDNYPEIVVQAELDALAASILSSKNQSLTQVSCKVGKKPPIQFDTQIDFQCTPSSGNCSALATSQKWFVNKSKYEAISGISQLLLSNARIVERAHGENYDGVTPVNNQQLIGYEAHKLEEHINPPSASAAKTNIESYTGHDITALSPRKFDYADKSIKAIGLGLLIEEVPEELNYIIAYDRYHQPKGINYHNLIIPILTDVQKIHGTIDITANSVLQLRTDLDPIIEEMGKLRTELEDLKKLIAQK